MIIAITVCSLLVLVILISWFRINAFISFIIVAILSGLALQIGVARTFNSIQEGMGSTLGSIVAIVILGAMLGKMIAQIGAVEGVMDTMLRILGEKNIRVAFMITGFIVGLPLFYTVGFLLLAPLVLSMAVRLKISPIYLGLPLLASLSVTQGYLPPHPGPMVLVQQLHADLGKTLIYGIIIAIPAILVSGLGFSALTKNINTIPNPEFVVNPSQIIKRPAVFISFFSILSPVLLISTGIVVSNFLNDKNAVKPIFLFLQNPTGSLLICVCMISGYHHLINKIPLKEISNQLTESVKEIANLLLIFAGAGALKEVLVDGGIQDSIRESLSGTMVNPLISGWFMAAIIRVSVGSSTIAGITTAGFILPLMSTDVRPELMVLSIGAGSMMFSHVNDTGFWLFREYFQSSLWDTLRTWSIMETLVSVVGLIMALVLNYFI